MDNYTSGSVVEPRVTGQPVRPTTSQNKPKLLYIVIIIVEAIVIVGLGIALISSFVSSNIDNEEGIIGNADEIPTHALTGNDANALMYTYAVASNTTLSGQTMPRDFCATLKKVYNDAEVDDMPVDDMCADNQIKLFSSDLIDDDRAVNGILHLGVLVGDYTYNYYILSDFSSLEYVEKLTDNIPTATVTLNVGSWYEQYFSSLRHLRLQMCRN